MAEDFTTEVVWDGVKESTDDREIVVIATSWVSV